MIYPRISIIILNWNGWKDTIECLESFQRIIYPNYQVIVVDNGSIDDSVEKIKEWARGNIHVKSRFFNYDSSTKPVQWIEYDRVTAEVGGIPRKEAELTQLSSNRKIVLIQAGKNLGFAGGNNVAIRYVLKRNYSYIGLLNNDTIVDSNYLTLIISTLKEDSQWTACSPKILFKGNPSRIWYVGAKIRMYKGGGIHIGQGEQDNTELNGIEMTTCLSGCAFIAKRVLFEKVGLLDEDFFFAHEDTHLFYQAGKQGMLFCVNLDAKIYHKAGGSVGQSPKAFYFDHKGRMIFIAKNGRHIDKLIFWSFWILTRLISFTLLIFKRKGNLIKAELRALHDFLTKRWGEYDRKRENFRNQNDNTSRK